MKSLGKELAEVIQYEDYEGRVTQFQLVTDQLREDFENFYKKIGHPNLNGEPQQEICYNILDLISSTQKNSYEEFNQLNYRLELLLESYGIKVQKNLDRIPRKKSQLSAQRNQIREWFSSMRSEMMESELKVKDAWKCMESFQLNSNQYTGGAYGKLLEKYSSNKQSQNKYLWEFFDEFLSITEDKDINPMLISEFQLQKIDVSGVTGAALTKIKQIIDFHQKIKQCFQLFEDDLFKRNRKSQQLNIN